MITLDGVNLPSDLFWADEFSWSPVQDVTQYSLAGSLLVGESKKLAGRPITLEGGPDRAWVPRSTVLTLQTMAKTMGRTMALKLADGREFTVRFRQESTGPVSAIQVAEIYPPEDGDYYYITLRLMAI